MPRETGKPEGEGAKFELMEGEVLVRRYGELWRVSSKHASAIVQQGNVRLFVAAEATEKNAQGALVTTLPREFLAAVLGACAMERDAR